MSFQRGFNRLGFAGLFLTGVLGFGCVLSPLAFEDPYKTEQAKIAAKRLEHPGWDAYGEAIGEYDTYWTPGKAKKYHASNVAYCRMFCAAFVFIGLLWLGLCSGFGWIISGFVRNYRTP